MRNCAHNVPTSIGGLKDGRTDGQKDEKMKGLEDREPLLLFEMAGNNKHRIELPDDSYKCFIGQ